ncbi:MAG: copper chaperone PCu(A)C [Ilumatobacteraceae bacterium]
MSRRLAQASAAALVALLLASCGGDEPKRASVVTASNGWASITIDGEQRSFVYVTLTSDADDQLTSASVPATVAGRASIAEGVSTGDPSGGHLGHLDGDGAPDHTHASSGIAIAADVPLTLEPGAGRIVLDDLVAPLRAGDRFVVTLGFDSGATVGTEVVVAASRPTG